MIESNSENEKNGVV